MKQQPAFREINLIHSCTKHKTRIDSVCSHVPPYRRQLKRAAKPEPVDYNFRILTRRPHFMCMYRKLFKVFFARTHVAGLITFNESQEIKYSLDCFVFLLWSMEFGVKCLKVSVCMKMLFNFWFHRVKL